ncbi:MAG: UDP-N-acetylmuramoyl-tripeptide--D-alanyl-D-alanine ligase, partial [Kiritimatiellae bacterium]|nr:UDP-N-acetylmuramoyl-tripeptide--D-alanyl-D-alanine ligase [Kiritimatiellia bacterium]
MTLDQALAWCGAAAEGPLPRSFAGVCTDTRNLRPGCLFVALRGERFDGHAFAAAAVEGGAGAVVADRAAALPPGLPVLRVADTCAALRDLAAGWRGFVAPKILGVTGSAGKTTTKELAAHLLGAAGSVAKTPGNFNNSVGLPLSLLAMPEGTAFGVFEAGTNHPGEIAPLAALMRPDAAVLVNVGPVHIGNFGSVDAIADEKADLLRAVPPSGTCVLDATGAHFAYLSRQCRGRVVSVSPDAATDADFKALEADPDSGDFTVFEAAAGLAYRLHSPKPGIHQIGNALLALAAARTFGGVSPEEARERLRSAPNTGMRWEKTESGGAVWVNDAYNANPLSMRRAVETFAAMRCAGRRVAVLGDMGELGSDEEEALHRDVGSCVASSRGIDFLVCVGARAAWIADGAAAAG